MVAHLFSIVTPNKIFNNLTSQVRAKGLQQYSLDTVTSSETGDLWNLMNTIFLTMGLDTMNERVRLYYEN